MHVDVCTICTCHVHLSSCPAASMATENSLNPPLAGPQIYISTDFVMQGAAAAGAGGGSHGNQAVA